MPARVHDEVIHRGRARYERHRARGTLNTYGLPPDPDRDLRICIEGLAGERILADLLGLPWKADSDGADYTGDVGEHEVRSTPHLDGHLIIYPGDPDARRCFLVIIDHPRYRVAGSIIIGDAKQPRYWRTPPAARHPSYWIPQEDLDPFTRPMPKTEPVKPVDSGLRYPPPPGAAYPPCQRCGHFHQTTPDVCVGAVGYADLSAEMEATNV